MLGTAKSDAKGYARFEPGLARGEGGLQPALLVAESDSGEYAFLDLTTGAFDLTDRGVKGREAPGPLDGYVYTERGVYRPGENVQIAALVRDKAGKAASLPVTLIVTRPDGVEHRRFTLNDQGLGGRELTLPLAGTAMTGTWRAKLHADPESDPITQVTFLVEDFVPERLDLKLEPPAGALIPGETQIIKAAGRYLYGPPAQDLAIEGDIVVKPSGKGVEGYAGYQFGQADESIEPVRKPLDAAATTDARGQRRRRRDAASRPADGKAARGERHPAPARDRRPHDRALSVDPRRPAAGRASASSRCSRARTSTRTRWPPSRSSCSTTRASAQPRPASPGGSSSSTPTGSGTAATGSGTTSP